MLSSKNNLSIIVKSSYYTTRLNPTGHINFGLMYDSSNIILIDGDTIKMIKCRTESERCFSFSKLMLSYTRKKKIEQIEQIIQD